VWVGGAWNNISKQASKQASNQSINQSIKTHRPRRGSAAHIMFLDSNACCVSSVLCGVGWREWVCRCRCRCRCMHAWVRNRRRCSTSHDPSQCSQHPALSMHRFLVHSDDIITHHPSHTHTHRHTHTSPLASPNRPTRQRKRPRATILSRPKSEQTRTRRGCGTPGSCGS
jgi:hypothetical protein